MSPPTPDQTFLQQLGYLQAEAKATREDQRKLWSAVAEIQLDQKRILETLNQARGSWRMLVGVASLSAGAGAGLFKILSFLTGPFGSTPPTFPH